MSGITCQACEEEVAVAEESVQREVIRRLGTNPVIDHIMTAYRNECAECGELPPEQAGRILRAVRQLLEGYGMWRTNWVACNGVEEPDDDVTAVSP